MTSYIPAELRRSVVQRAKGRCEYCRIRESDTFYGCQIDHIIAEKHDDETVNTNLSFTCAYLVDHPRRPRDPSRYLTETYLY